MVIQCYRLISLLTISAFLTTGCKAPDYSIIKAKAMSLVPNEKMIARHNGSANEGEKVEVAQSLETLLTGALADKNEGLDFSSIISFALQKDPVLV